MAGVLVVVVVVAATFSTGFSRSVLSIRPSLPVPVILERSIPFYLAKCLTAGVANLECDDVIVYLVSIVYVLVVVVVVVYYVSCFGASTWSDSTSISRKSPPTKQVSSSY